MMRVSVPSVAALGFRHDSVNAPGGWGRGDIRVLNGMIVICLTTAPRHPESGLFV